MASFCLLEGIREAELKLTSFPSLLFYVNEPVVSLVLPAFDDTGSLDSLPRQVVYPPGSMVLLWVIVSVSLRVIGRLN